MHLHYFLNSFYFNLIMFPFHIVPRCILKRFSRIVFSPTGSFYSSATAEADLFHCIFRSMASTPCTVQSCESKSSKTDLSPIRWIFRHSTWEPTETQWRHALSCVPSKEQEKILRYFHRRDAKASLVNY